MKSTSIYLARGPQPARQQPRHHAGGAKRSNWAYKALNAVPCAVRAVPVAEYLAAR